MKHRQVEQLRKVIKLVDVSVPRQLTKANSSVQARRLDRRLSASAIAQLVDAYLSGSSTGELCERHHLSKGGLLKILLEHGAEMRYQPMTEDEIDRAVELYAAGDSLRTIGLKLKKGQGQCVEGLACARSEDAPIHEITWRWV
ncbi:helix-turn-helix domain-containing protein [Nocardia sp. NBC_00565]|uniref:helix-turn-helix domain-containing protein n=1 Tax=Nocardia sp. NBC_00565 TaxID=2975993 RepID=UPI002E818823|nr:helix-turn-helix domain-containing protein [Nocardia sp. NBC_00565]WUC04812.1 helix-turn-helix domain-containing protein [Nocardia sp. NBC_00565]